MRTLIELLVSLAILVTLFRVFVVGGYLIETGSMAPCLVGYHRRATCPSCRYPFAVEASRKPGDAVCPNCGQAGVALTGLPRNDGDHLLVSRQAYEFRRPRRWEVVVFRNPGRPAQAYVKRMIGLPGETIEIVRGDIFIDGRIQAKPYETQRGMRIPVYDHDFRPDADDPDWQSRWVPGQPENGWTPDGGTFRFVPKRGPPGEGRSNAEFSWIDYRHWVRRGGAHTSSAPLANWPGTVEQPVLGPGPVTYDAGAGEVTCRGALPRGLRDELLRASDDPTFRQAIERLYDVSHVAPITDVYGYNRDSGSAGEHEVRDLMIEFRVTVRDSTGRLVVELSDGTETLQCLFDLEQRRARLVDTRTGKALRTAPLPADFASRPVVVEMSLMDRQALAAVDGKPLFEPWSYPAGVERGPSPSRPVRIGASRLQVAIDRLKLFRDVYYTAGEGRRFDGAARELRANEYFVLGDNSPLSRDSRSWSDKTLLSDDLLLGKPLVVHLPSRTARFQVGRWQTAIRVPELSRIRYIH